MDLFERLMGVAERARDLQGNVQTEEATKNGLILPFLRALGYDPFDPTEINPEFTVDVGVRKHEKVDYAICRDGHPMMLVECKRCGTGLDRYSSQLYRYFSVTPARIAILTDGITYRFYSDLAEINKLDPDPFLEINLDRLSTENAAQVQRFSKATFDIESILGVAEEMRYSKAIRDHFASLLADPPDDFLRMMIETVHRGRVTGSVLDRFRGIVKKATNRYVSDMVDQRLMRAINQSKESRVQEPQQNSVDSEEEEQIESTVEEMQGFYIVKAILSGTVEPSRIVPRDVRSYFGVLLDDNNRKPICRLWFNGRQKYLGVFDNEKSETRVAIATLDEIFSHANLLKESLGFVLK